jgi:hypothetical protein
MLYVIMLNVVAPRDADVEWGDQKSLNYLSGAPLRPLLTSLAKKQTYMKMFRLETLQLITPKYKSFVISTLIV